MPDAQTEIHIAFEVLDATLEPYAGLSPSDHAELLDACENLLYGTEPSQVAALLSGSAAHPFIPVSGGGVPELSDCWTRVLSLIVDYNELDTGLEFVLESAEPSVMPRPHCASMEYVNGVWVIVVNWGVELAFGARTESVYPVSKAAGISTQVLAMGHVAIRVPIVPAP